MTIQDDSRWVQAWFLYIDPATGTLTTDRAAPVVSAGSTRANRVRIVIPGPSIELDPDTAEHLAGRIMQAALAARGADPDAAACCACADGQRCSCICHRAAQSP